MLHQRTAGKYLIRGVGHTLGQASMLGWAFLAQFEHVAKNSDTPRRRLQAKHR